MAEMLTRVSSAELTEWEAFFRVRNEEREEEEAAEG